MKIQLRNTGDKPGRPRCIFDLQYNTKTGEPGHLRVPIRGPVIPPKTTVAVKETVRLKEPHGAGGFEGDVLYCKAE
ncbi:MAG: hypothetical protein M3280_05950 [Actinomycetota bacterium]|nr:hypothetical protein [Actinomycetota bacterium]